MTSQHQLPACVHAMRIGYNRESSYDINGELAPITWICDCGCKLTLEKWADEERLDYIPISESLKTEFLTQHTNCAATCYNCGITTVETYGLWCEACEA